MKRRLDLAAALVHNPEVLFLDEPTTGLDPRSRASVWAEVRRLNIELGMTIFLTTQYLEEADDPGRPGGHHLLGPPGGRRLARRPEAFGRTRRDRGRGRGHDPAALAQLERLPGSTACPSRTDGITYQYVRRPGDLEPGGTLARSRSTWRSRA